jgi:hypothetical protein
MNGLTFKVTDSRQVDTLTPAGNTVTVYRVNITTSHGATGTLDVDKADWTPEKLPALLAAKADDLDLAFALTR